LIPKKNLGVGLNTAEKPLNGNKHRTQPLFLSKMDTGTNFEDFSLLGDFPGDTESYLFCIDDERYLSSLDFSPDAFSFDLKGSHIEPTMTTLVQGQGGTHLGQYSCPGYLSDEIMQDGLGLGADEDGCLVPGIMSDYDGTSSLAPSSPAHGRYLGASNYSLSPKSLQKQAGLSTSSGDTGTVQQYMKDGNPTLREILPRPAEWVPINSEVKYSPTKKRRDEGAKNNRLCDLTKEKRKVTKPVLCHLCLEKFAFLRGLKRHYVVSHRDYAASIGLPVARSVCPIPGCLKTYTRSDNLTRHLTNDHGRRRR